MPPASVATAERGCSWRALWTIVAAREEFSQVMGSANTVAGSSFVVLFAGS